MNRAAALFEKLSDADVDWIFGNAIEQQLLKGEPLITAGQPVTAISIVARGLLGVFSPGREEKLAVVGPGGVVGEMSLLEDRVPTESVVALETTSALVVPHAALEERFGRDPHFAARLYRGMAKSLSQRLRRTNSRLAVAMHTPAPTPAPSEATGAVAAAPPAAPEPGAAGRERVAAAIAELESLIHRADEAALRSQDTVPADLAGHVGQAMGALYPLLNEVAGEGSPEPEDARERIGLYAQKQLLPYLLLMRTAERLYSKPRGYPGDFQTIDAIQHAAARGSSRIGPVLDRVFLDAPICVAIRERRAVLAQVIYRAAAFAPPGQPARVVSLGCGPATELFDAYAEMDDPALLLSTAVDFDPQALAMVAERRERQKLREQVQMMAINPVFLALGRTELEGGPQDLVYSSSLADYFDDPMMVKLLNLCHASLRPGGRVVFSVVHPRNPCRAFMDHVLEWRLTHRTEDDLNRLAQASAFGAPCARVWKGSEGITLFAECVRGEGA